jgi:hypothetical protein
MFIKTTKRFGNWICFRLQTLTLLGPLERASLNHWLTETDPVSETLFCFLRSIRRCTKLDSSSLDSIVCMKHILILNMFSCTLFLYILKIILFWRYFKRSLFNALTALLFLVKCGQEFFYHLTVCTYSSCYSVLCTTYLILATNTFCFFIMEGWNIYLNSFISSITFTYIK